MKNIEGDKSEEALSLTIKFLKKRFSKKDFSIIEDELLKLKIDNYSNETSVFENYKDLQEYLAKINEKNEIRKKRGVYYTPTDVVKYIISNVMKVWNKELLNEKKTAKVFDPTCGVGEFILEFLDYKLNLLEKYNEKIEKRNILKILKTIYGNDINIESINIVKIRIILKILERYNDISFVQGISKILNKNFQSYDFIKNIKDEKNKYDIIVGNPPYVEDSKSELVLEKKYGNIYANVLDNSMKILNKNGAMGFVIPLSYISTPRMGKIRERMFNFFKKHYILSFSDRPDSLFSSVHQKLCICFFGDSNEKEELYTSSYKYWYKKERKNFLQEIPLIKNEYRNNEFIPKLGEEEGVSIYKKMIRYDRSLFDELKATEGEKLYLNMRVTFWIKVFEDKPKSSEYKEFMVKKENKDFIYCLLNSSLFWWYWVCVSDCWHITHKELKSFLIPNSKIINNNIWNKLAKNLKIKLEETKVFVGTKQINYEYKHKNCLKIINEIDDYICEEYNLNVKEKEYIKNFALKYRKGENFNGSN